MTVRKNLRKFYGASGTLVRLWQTFIYALVFVSIIELLMEYNFIPHTYDIQTLKWADVTIAFIFLADYLFRLFIAENRKKFIVKPYNILDILAILPSFLVFMDGAQALRGARLIRAFRAFRIMRLIHIAHLIEKRTKPAPKVYIEARDEIRYYGALKMFYEEVRKGKKPHTLVRDTKTLFNSLNKEINDASVTATVDSRRTFAIAFYELARQAFPIIRHLQESPECANEQRKLRFILREMGDLLSAEAGLNESLKVEERETSRLAYLYLLLRGSINDVIFIATIAFCINLFIRIMNWDHILAPALEYISVVEGVLGTLIIMITTFNIRYANKKRHDMDIEAMRLMNFLTYYSTRIRTLLDNFEEDDNERKRVAKELKYYFDTIAFSMLHSAQAKDMQEVRFDTASMQVLERIRFAIKPYKEQLDTRTFDKYEEMHGNASLKINQFQVQATTSIPTLFNELNHWLIRMTYFLLLTLSPLASIPRIIVMYILQRAFFRTSQETDSAILSHSLARLPLEQRVVRRMCRIGAIFSY